MNSTAWGAFGGRVDFARSLTAVDGVPVLEVSGEIEIKTREEFRDGLRELLETQSSLVILDLTKVSFFDSTGLHELDDAYHSAQSDDRRIALVGLQPNVVRLFQITGLNTRYSIYSTAEQASSTR